MEDKTMDILAHICCGPCAVVFTSNFEALDKEQNGSLSLLWHNPNIHPYTEYRARFKSAEAFAVASGLPLTVSASSGEGYGLRGFLRDVHGKTIDNRCEHCYHSRLEYTAQQAVAAGIGAFTTTLLVSPYQNFDAIKRIGTTLALQHGLEFVAPDFRAAYREGLTLAADMGLYRQKYCGCIFSEEERYLNIMIRPQNHAQN